MISGKRDDIVSELPDGYTYAGTIYDSPDSTENFAGNYVADVYMNREIPDVAKIVQNRVSIYLAEQQ